MSLGTCCLTLQTWRTENIKELCYSFRKIEKTHTKTIAVVNQQQTEYKIGDVVEVIPQT